MALDTVIIEMSEIMKLIPQKPPIVMVDKLLLYEEKKSVSGFTIQKENIFLVNNKFSEAGLTENIAQTAALHKGYTNMLAKKQPPVGFIGAIKNLLIHNLPACGDELRTEVNLIINVFDFDVITGSVSCKGKVLAECEMKIFTRNDEVNPV